MGTPFRVLLLTNRDSDNVGDQIIEATTLSLLRTVFSSLGFRSNEYTISSHAAGIVSWACVEATGQRREELLRPAITAIQNCDVVVFGGAPMLSYKYRKLYLRTVELLKIASQFHRPVIFSAIGIDGYDEDSEKCQLVKKWLNIPEVRQITTRDGLEFLSRFVESDWIAWGKVSDPAVFTDRVFEQYAARPDMQTGIVGVIVPRVAIFRDNGIDFSPKNQLTFYRELLDEIQKRGYRYRLFTTGHFSDEVALCQLISSMDLSPEQYRLTVNCPEELIGELAECDGVVSARLHGSIVSYSMDIPSVGLSWNSKVSAFYEAVGYADRCFSARQVDASEMADALFSALGSHNERDPEYLSSVYVTLLDAFSGLFTEMGVPMRGAKRLGYADLLRELPSYGGTSQEEYKTKVERKLKRTYQSSKFANAFDPPGGWRRRLSAMVNRRS